MDKIKNSKILITGGAGFIGSNLVDTLIESNEIVVVDDLSMGKSDNLPLSQYPQKLHFFEHSITDKAFMEKILLHGDFDYIFLLGAVASVADTIERPLETHEINQNANINILEIIRVNKLSVKKVLFTSSAAVYGNNPELPKKETSPIDPLSPYAIDKYATERFVIDYGRLYGIPTVCTRFFNVYGPKQNPNSPYSGVLSLISKAIKNNENFTIFGDGEQTRDFVYVRDVTNTLECLAENSESTFKVFNVATGKSTSLNHLIKIFEKISSMKLNVHFKEERAGDIKNSVADTTKLNQYYQMQFTLTEGLTEYWHSLD